MTEQSTKVSTWKILIPTLLGVGVIIYMFSKDLLGEENAAQLEELKNISITWNTVFWFFIALLLMVGRDLGFTIRYRYLTEKMLSWKQSLKITLLAEFGTAVTPSSVGGSSMAVLYFWPCSSIEKRMPDSIQHQKDDAFRNAADRRRAFPAFLILGLLCVGLALVYVFQGMTPETWDFNMARRIPIVIALVLVGTAVGLSSVVFQTITTNYILTPSVMGLDNLYVLLQTLVLYFVGSTQLTTMQSPLCFMGALLLMVCVSTGIFFYMFRGQNGGNIYFVVLVGMIFGITFGGLSNFMQVLIDPSEFAILEGRLFASFNRINEELLLTAGLVIAAAVIWLVCDLRKLDVLTLGRSTAITLGVNYKWVVLRSLMIVSILASASTVLVGPVTFLGILIVSIARFIFPTYRHIVLMPGTALVGVAALTFGMLLTERWLNFSVPLSVIINFVGGVYFIYLIMKIKRI